MFVYWCTVPDRFLGLNTFKGENPDDPEEGGAGGVASDAERLDLAEDMGGWDWCFLAFLDDWYSWVWVEATLVLEVELVTEDTVWMDAAVDLCCC